MKSIRLAIRIFPLAVVLLIVCVFLFVSLGRVDRTVEASGEVGVSRYHIVRPQVSGFAAEIWVEPGDKVTRGQVLMRLEDHRFARETRDARKTLRDLENRLSQARTELRMQRLVIHPLERSRQEEEIERKELDSAVSASRVSELDLELEIERQRHFRMQEMARHGLSSQQQLQEAAQTELIAEQRLRRSRLEARQARAEGPSAQGDLRLLEGEQARLISNLEGQIRQFELDASGQRAELRRLAELRELHTLRAGFDGVILGEPINDLRDRYVQAGEELFRVIDPASIHFISRVPEQVIVQVRSGQTAQVQISGLPVGRFEAFSGMVSRVAQRPEAAGEGPSFFPVRIQLDKPWLALTVGRYYLRSGMRGTVEIAYRRDVSILRVLYEFLIGVPQVPDSSEPGAVAVGALRTDAQGLSSEIESRGSDRRLEDG